MPPSLVSFLQVRLPHPDLPRDVPHLWPPPVVRPVSTPSHTFPSSPLWRSHSSVDLQRPNYQELTPTTLMGALLPISQLHHVSERYCFLPQFLFHSSIARINVERAVMHSRHSNTLQKTARFTVHCMGGDYIVAARPHYSCPLTSQLMYIHSTIIPESPQSRRPNVLKY